MIDPVDLPGDLARLGDRRSQDWELDPLDGRSSELDNEPADWPRPTETADRDPAVDHHSLNAVADLAEAMAVQQRRTSRPLPRIDHGPKLELLPDPELLAAWENQQAARWSKPAGGKSAQFSGSSPEPSIEPLPEPSPESSPGSVSSLADSTPTPTTENSPAGKILPLEPALAEGSVPTMTGDAATVDATVDPAPDPAPGNPATVDTTVDPATVAPAIVDTTVDPATVDAAASLSPTADDALPRWERMVLRLPADLAGGGLAWAQVWQQLMHRLHDGDRPWQAQAGVTLGAIDHGLEARQMQAIAVALAESQLVLDRVISNDPTTAAAAIASALSLDYQPGERAANRQAAVDPGDCLYLDQPVRSGVEIRYPGSVVVRGDVNPGGAIAAGGDVLVWGRLRGLAHAGTQGNARAVILALHLDAPQVRIAQRAARVPDSALESPIPEVAYISGTNIRISPAADFAKIEFEERIR